MDFELDIDFFLADSAQASNGKIHALGLGWNVLQSQQFPFMQPSITVCMLIHVPYTHTDDEQVISIELQDADGQLTPIGWVPSETGEQQPMTQVQMNLAIDRNTVGFGDDQTVPFVLQFGNIPFNAPGNFTWVISVNGVPVKRKGMRVIGAFEQ